MRFKNADVSSVVRAADPEEGLKLLSANAVTRWSQVRSLPAAPLPT
ncbi:MAG TPA: hypothetical protein VK503_03140 [Candidatus Bathyarchaeia archaeon]|nr:hypothetical protein [Candidatus Bathyarchaeia archaeon]